MTNLRVADLMNMTSARLSLRPQDELRPLRPNATMRTRNAIADLLIAAGVDGRSAHRHADKLVAPIELLTPLGNVSEIEDGYRSARAAADRGDTLGRLSGSGRIAAAALPIAGTRLAKLPMDQASRLARAKAMGFRIEEPVYHGTDRVFDAFDLKAGGRTTGSRTAPLGVWASHSPNVADEFARMAIQQGKGRARGPLILPLLYRSDRLGVYDAGKHSQPDREAAVAIASAFDDGFDAVRILNYRTPGGKTGQTTVVVKDPSQLRSIFAAFDPKKRDSANLLAGIGAGVAGTGLVASQAADERRQHPLLPYQE